MMKTSIAVALVALLAGPIAAQAAVNKMTGTVSEVRADAIVVQKGKKQIEIARTPGTAIQGELKKGAKVTVEYEMSATSITAKPDKKSRNQQ